MPANLIDKKHITELAAKAAGLDKKGGNPRLKTIMNRLLSDLFQAIDDLDISMDEFWAGVGYIGASGQANELGVGFQEVVHLVRTEEAEVAKLQCSTERPDEHPQECSPDAERSRGHGAVCGSRTEQGRRRAPVQYYCEDCRQMG